MKNDSYVELRNSVISLQETILKNKKSIKTNTSQSVENELPKQRSKVPKRPNVPKRPKVLKGMTSFIHRGVNGCCGRIIFHRGLTDKFIHL